MITEHTVTPDMATDEMEEDIWEVEGVGVTVAPREMMVMVGENKDDLII